MRIVIFHALHVYFVYRANMHILQLSQFILIAHELCRFGKKLRAEHVNQVRLIK
jgi:hypothetical protein